MKKKKILSLIIIVIIALLGYATYKKFYTPHVQGQMSETEIQNLVKKVSKLIIVPEEAPVIATITKADQLIAEQKFYAGSKDGDYLLIFPTAQKAIIFRESENKLINVGPIIVDQPATTTKSVSTEVKATTSTTEATSTDEEDEE